MNQRFDREVKKEDMIVKKIILAAAIAMTFGSCYVFAHHPAEGTVDQDIWDMIDENVEDTPHAELFLDDMGGSDSPAPGMDSDLGSGNSGAEGARNAANR